MKFTDLNFDCLEAVLEYLELIDLLNVADSTKRLNKAAELVFARKHGNKIVGIWIPRIRDRSFTIKDKIIEIKDLKTALQLLRCFGPVISLISFIESAGNLSEIDQKVIAYINKYCADYLEDLRMIQCSYKQSNLFNYFNVPFPKLKTFHSIDFVSTGNVCLNRLFPKMRCLNITHLQKNANFSFYNIITKHYPYLEEVYICERNRPESSLRNEMLINLLQLNPQLRKLRLFPNVEKCIFNTDLIRSAVDSLQNIESLTLHDLKPITFLDDSDNIIRMKSVNSFCIRFESHFEFSPYLLPFSFENLENFRIIFPKTQILNRSFTDQFFNFIDKHSSITNLMIHEIERFVDVDWSRLAKSLPLLLEIDITECCNISDDEAIKIMTKFQMLNKFRFQISGDYDNFSKRLDKNWHGTYKTEKKIVELHRKM